MTSPGDQQRSMHGMFSGEGGAEADAGYTFDNDINVNSKKRKADMEDDNEIPTKSKVKNPKISTITNKKRVSIKKKAGGSKKKTK